MKTPLCIVCVAMVIAVMLSAENSASAAETGTLDEHLESFRPFLGKTWRGVFKDSTPDKPTVDVSRWERALNGKAIRVLHSVNDGSYGGESLIFWDTEKKEIRYYYFTTAGFYTTGSSTFQKGKFLSVEKVAGNTNGITEVRSTSELRSDGTMLSKAEYLRDGKLVSEREVVYREDPKSEVRFK